MFYSFLYTGLLFGQFIPKYFIIFFVMVNGIVSHLQGISVYKFYIFQLHYNID